MNDEAQDVMEDEVDEVEEIENDEIQTAFDDSVSVGMDEDDTKMAMIQAGATFKTVTRLYNSMMIDAGLAISKADRDTIISALMDGRDLSELAGLDSAIAAVVTEVAGSTVKSAAAMIRAFAKKNGLEVYKKPKGEGKSRTGFAHHFYNFLVANPTADKEACTAYINDQPERGDSEISQNVIKHTTHYLGIADLVNKVAANG